MKIGAFEITEPVPELREPHALVTLTPWVDVGRVGREALIRLERYMDAKELGRLARPGNFYDFTRYRPTMINVGGERRMTIPNTALLYAKREQPPDFLFFHLLEPHVFGEEYVESVMEVLRHFDARQYTQIGGVSDAVPHTRPLLVSGTVPDEEGERLGIRRSNYQGPTSIVYVIAQEAQKLGIDTRGFLVHLPNYTQLDEDHSGVSRLLEIICGMYDLPARLIDGERGQRQYKRIDTAMARNPLAGNLIQQLEANYDAKARDAGDKAPPPLAPEVERFLREMDKRMDEEKG